jgi:hypothetical protein
MSCGRDHLRYIIAQRWKSTKMEAGFSATFRH